MRLYLAGINHNDPLGRDSIYHWLKGIKEATPPAFVAVEWGEQVFKLLEANRLRLRIELGVRFPDVESDVIQTLADALAYEGDSHKGMYPDADVIWLDSARVCIDKGKQLTNEEIAEKTVRGRRSVMELWLSNRSRFDSSESFLDQTSCEAWASAATTEASKRDKDFADLILSRAKEGGWGIVITGEEHTQDEEGRMRHMLRQKGRDCKVTSLSPLNETT